MKSRNLFRNNFTPAILATTLVLVACAGKITSENYSQINTGMSQPDVEKILGPGTEQASTSVAMPAMPSMPAVPGAPAPAASTATPVTTKVLVWRNGGRMITVTLVNEKVFAKAQVGL